MKLIYISSIFPWKSLGNSLCVFFYTKCMVKYLLDCLESKWAHIEMSYEILLNGHDFVAFVGWGGN